MARTPARPGRTLVVFLLGMAITYGLVALAGQWKPELGLDLQGGTRITLVAEGEPSAENMEQARQIIEQRVNGGGVTEAEVTQQGDSIIVVEIPGKSRRELVETVERQAQMRFRLVACTSADARCSTAADPNAPTGGVDLGNGMVIPTEGADPSGDAASPSAPAGNNRPGVAFAEQSPSPSPSPSGAATGAPSGTPAPSPSGPAAPAAGDVESLLQWQDDPDAASVKQFNDFTCPEDPLALNVEDDPAKPLVTCDEQGIKYLLSAAAIEGTDLEDAAAGIPQGSAAWAVTLEIGGKGEDAFEAISRRLVGTEKQFAIVLDGRVLSAPTMEGVISNGQAQITGDFGETEAMSLATSLKYGSLPIKFADDTSSETIGPTLAGDQLTAGLTAGAVGLGLVLLYCMIYYRGLGTVVVASLAMAALATYALVLLLSETANFTLTLPGIAGLIVAVGITADSFIILFERIRDEMRDGKSMRVAVESGWVRARATCLAADAVSLLAAVVLYIFATGVVKGFAFALGLSTIIDLIVFFWFTKPMVSWLARYKFFNSGHRFSGLSAETLGVDALPAGGKA